ncbi:unnamed protein product [Trichogramma brassicae]|uniref:Uncharacterized protein n=1 Tax=Trichogramma brassicae TaxID=86971 RepID=A0A6H5HX61_9HYME|nr:unnamed protein product [Trichogramma brassicae]
MSYTTTRTTTTTTRLRRGDARKRSERDARNGRKKNSRNVRLRSERERKWLLSRLLVHPLDQFFSSSTSAALIYFPQSINKGSFTSKTLRREYWNAPRGVTRGYDSTVHCPRDIIQCRAARRRRRRLRKIEEGLACKKCLARSRQEDRGSSSLIVVHSVSAEPIHYIGIEIYCRLVDAVVVARSICNSTRSGARGHLYPRVCTDRGSSSLMRSAQGTRRGSCACGVYYYSCCIV